MKNTIELKVDQRVGIKAIRILRAIPDLDVTVESHRPTGLRPDAVIRHVDRETRIAVEFKSRVDVGVAHHIAHIAKSEPEMPLLLIAGETTTAARKVLVDEDVAYIDGFGNVHLELPGLTLRLAGTRKPSPTRARATLSGKSGLVAQVLLLDPDRSWHVKDVVEEIDVSAGLVHRVMTRLEGSGIVETTGTGPRRTRTVTDPSALLDLWNEEQTDRPVKTFAYHLAQTPRRLIEGLGERLDAACIGHAFTGTAGASIVAPFVTSVPVAEVWIDAATPDHDLFDPPATTPVTGGHNIVFLQERDNAPLAFRTHLDGIWVANPFRLYHDLRQDPRRGAAQADHLREQVIGF